MMSQQTSVDLNWQRQQDPPSVIMTRLLNLNNHEFVIVPQRAKEGDANGIYKYNAICKKWTKILHYPEEFTSTGHLATIDENHKIIYVCNEQSQLLTINLIIIFFITKVW